MFILESVLKCNSDWSCITSTIWRLLIHWKWAKLVCVASLNCWCDGVVQYIGWCIGKCLFSLCSITCLLSFTVIYYLRRRKSELFSTFYLNCLIIAVSVCIEVCDLAPLSIRLRYGGCFQNERMSKKWLHIVIIEHPKLPGEPLELDQYRKNLITNQ